MQTEGQELMVCANGQMYSSWKTTLLKFSNIVSDSNPVPTYLCRAQTISLDSSTVVSASSVSVSCMQYEVGNPSVFCNICSSILCDHSPSVVSVDGTLVLSYNTYP